MALCLKNAETHVVSSVCGALGLTIISNAEKRCIDGHNQILTLEPHNLLSFTAINSYKVNL